MKTIKLNAVLSEMLLELSKKERISSDAYIEKMIKLLYQDKFK